MNNQTLNPLPFFDSPLKQTDLFESKMLGEHREYVIKDIKDPLRMSLMKIKGFWSLVVVFFIIIQSAWRIRNKVGKVTKETSVFAMTHFLIDEKAKFFKMHFNPGRDKMFEGAWDIGIAVSAHDPYYRFLAYWFALEIIEAYESGTLSKELIIPEVMKPCWEVKNGSKRSER